MNQNTLSSKKYMVSLDRETQVSLGKKILSPQYLTIHNCDTFHILKIQAYLNRKQNLTKGVE